MPGIRYRDNDSYLDSFFGKLEIIINGLAGQIEGHVLILDIRTNGKLDEIEMKAYSEIGSRDEADSGCFDF